MCSSVNRDGREKCSRRLPQVKSTVAKAHVLSFGTGPRLASAGFGGAIVKFRGSVVLQCLVLFAFVATIFGASPNHQEVDSRYSVLLSEYLLRTHRFYLERSFDIPLDPVT